MWRNLSCYALCTASVFIYIFLFLSDDFCQVSLPLTTAASGKHHVTTFTDSDSFFLELFFPSDYGELFTDNPFTAYFFPLHFCLHVFQVIFSQAYFPPISVVLQASCVP